MELVPTFAIPGSPYAALVSPQMSSVSHLTAGLSAGPDINSIALELPLPSYPPTAQDWNNFRAVIEALYIQQRWTLHDVEHELGLKYGFYANDRMYKGRLAKWHARAYYTKEDYVRILSALLNQATDLGSMNIHGRPIDWPRVRRRLSSTTDPICNIGDKPKLLKLIAKAQEDQTATAEVSQPTESTVGHPACVLSAPKRFALSYPEQDLEILLSGLNDYIKEHFMSAKGGYFWRPESNRPACAGPSMYGRPFSSVVHPAELNQHYSRGLKLIATNHLDAGFSLLDRACAVIQQILQQQHPALISSLLSTLAGHSLVGLNSIQDHIARLTCQMSTIILGSHHPITRLCCYLRSHRKIDGIIDFWSRYTRLFSDQLSKGHRLCIYMNQKLLETLLDAESYQDALYHIEENLDPVFTVSSSQHNCIENASPACLCYLRRKAKVFRGLRRFDEAIELHCIVVNLLQRLMGDQSQSPRGNPSFEEAFRTAEEVAVLFELANHYPEAMQAHQFALDVCLFVRGDADSKTSTLIFAHEKRLMDHGQLAAAANLRSRFPSFFNGQNREIDHNRWHCHPCPNCANGQASQSICIEHHLQQTQSEHESNKARQILDELKSMVNRLKDLEFHHGF